ncbi:microviridin/marinostatin family tricyclic proteinase inhibitor [Archangium violaceum]|uniref:microviridin/marinostatin family tricyclic proteinase inhibitor n=1 Tax=Archangium violaceum TaxID=83451 RepID=UPI0019517FFF|nr:microviridin/marinostatin family tricyclic proteinase inhibitor [Archangium violaceum]QRN98646.1 microviridin/marinostatin family tricyclic proteinase inhibitor [Archangium violaceum]
MKKKASGKAPLQGKKPFFARLLDAQELEQAAGGRPVQTKKYPSDKDECDPVFVTLKFPSDKDEGPAY